MNKLATIATLCIGLCTLSVDTFASEFAKVNVPVLNVREKASIESNVLHKLMDETLIEVLEAQGEWYKIKTEGLVGYVSSEFVDLQQYTGKVYNTDYVNVRDFPSTKTGNIVTKLKEGEILNIIGKDGDFYKVSLNGIEVYIHSDYVYTENDITPSTETPRQPNTNQNSILTEELSQEEIEASNNWVVKEEPIKEEPTEKEESLTSTQRVYKNNIDISGDYSYRPNIAKTVPELIEDLEQGLGKTHAEEYSKIMGYSIALTGLDYIGTPYVYGGTSFETGLDCSAFTQNILKMHSVNIPRTSYDQADVGESIKSIEDIQPGDLVFFGEPNKAISHVGIYIGSDKMVHSGNENTGVTIDNIFRFGEKKIRYIKRMV